MIQVKIEEKACRGCQQCVDICPTEVFRYEENERKAQVAEESNCIGCLSCTYLCPSTAISQSSYHTVKNFYRDVTFSRRMEKFL